MVEFCHDAADHDDRAAAPARDHVPRRRLAAVVRGELRDREDAQGSLPALLVRVLRPRPPLHIRPWLRRPPSRATPPPPTVDTTTFT